MTRYLEDPPKDVESAILDARKVGARLLSDGRYSDAFQTYRHVYQLMLEKQPPGRRWHKGELLHNMGFAWLKSKVWEVGVQYTLMAFIEDSLSCGDTYPKVFDELQKPAAQNLRLCGFSGAELRSMAKKIRARLEDDMVVQDPETLLLKDGNEQRVRAAVELLEMSPNPDPPRPFVGPPASPSRDIGNPIVAFSDLLGRLEPIKGRIATLGSLVGVAMAVVGFLAPVLGFVAAALVVGGVALIAVSVGLFYLWTRPANPR
jgi:hypothetical protein